MLPPIRRVLPNLINTQIVSVQPMAQPVGGLSFYLDAMNCRYALKVGDTVRGTKRCPVHDFVGVIISIDKRENAWEKCLVVECAHTGTRYVMDRPHVERISLLDGVAAAATDKEIT